MNTGLLRALLWGMILSPLFLSCARDAAAPSMAEEPMEPRAQEGGAPMEEAMKSVAQERGAAAEDDSDLREDRPVSVPHPAKAAPPAPSPSVAAPLSQRISKRPPPARRLVKGAKKKRAPLRLKRDKETGARNKLSVDDETEESNEEVVEDKRKGGGQAEKTFASRPTRFLPRVGYFENTYLGGNAAYLERIRRLDLAFEKEDRVYHHARAVIADLDPPRSHGLALSARLSRRSLQKPGRVFLEIGLRGSQRYGWRRPPLDLAVVLDGQALIAGPEVVRRTLLSFARTLGPQDRMLVLQTGVDQPKIVVSARAASSLHFGFAAQLKALGSGARGGSLQAAMALAGTELDRLGSNTHRVPGARVVLLMVDAQGRDRGQLAQQEAHRLTLKGAVTSVLTVGLGAPKTSGGWWRVANAGHGSYRLVTASQEKKAVQAELESLSRVVARLIRVNIRLGESAHALRVIGSRMLGEREVHAVKAREKVIDQKLSESMGLKADRGDDDDGLQTVIPYFLGGDSHVILIELWVDSPGPVAEIGLRYKDLVTLDNATARVSVALTGIGQSDTIEQRLVRHAASEAELAERLDKAARLVRSGATPQAIASLEDPIAPSQGGQERALLRDFKRLIREQAPQSTERRALVAEALELARARQLGE